MVKVLGMKREQNSLLECCLLMDVGFTTSQFPLLLAPDKRLGGKEEGKCERRRIHYSCDFCSASEGES